MNITVESNKPSERAVADLQRSVCAQGFSVRAAVNAAQTLRPIPFDAA